MTLEGEVQQTKTCLRSSKGFDAIRELHSHEFNPAILPATGFSPITRDRPIFSIAFRCDPAAINAMIYKPVRDRLCMKALPTAPGKSKRT